MRREKDILKRWKEYLKKRIYEENERLLSEDKKYRIVLRVRKKEVDERVKKMKSRKARGPDNLQKEERHTEIKLMAYIMKVLSRIMED